MWNESPMSALTFTPSLEENVIDSSTARPSCGARRPHHVLHAGREDDDLLGERVVEDPPGDDRHVLHAAIAAGELHPDADVTGVDARRRLAADEENDDENRGGDENPLQAAGVEVRIESVHGIFLSCCVVT